jgi:hypothetical protein
MTYNLPFIFSLFSSSKICPERILQLEDIYIKIAIQKKKPKHKVGLNY